MTSTPECRAPVAGRTPSTRIGASISLAVLAPLLVLSIIASFPVNIVMPGQSVRSWLSVALPQSWQFFTKSPDDLELTAYQVTPGGGTRSLSLTPNSRPSNWFGLRRSQRSQGPEIAAIANSLTRWSKCEPSQDCVAQAAAGEPVQVVNRWEHPTLCGPVVLVQTRPVPWAYRNRYDGWRLDVKTARVDAACTN